MGARGSNPVPSNQRRRQTATRAGLGDVWSQLAEAQGSASWLPSPAAAAAPAASASRSFAGWLERPAPPPPSGAATKYYRP